MRVIFDIDGVMIPLMECICQRHNIDFSKMKSYQIRDNDITTLEQDLIFEDFNNPYVFELAGFSKGITELNSLGKDKKFELRIVSESCNDGVKFKKAEMIQKALPDVKNLAVYLIDINEKIPFLNQCDVFVEDSLDNLVCCYNRYEYGLLINKPYNQVENEEEFAEKYPNIRRIDSFKDAVEFVRVLYLAESMRNSSSFAEAAKDKNPIKRKTVFIKNEIPTDRAAVLEYTLRSRIVDIAGNRLSQWDLIVYPDGKDLVYAVLVSDDKVYNGVSVENLPTKFYKARFTDDELKIYKDIMEKYTST